MIRMDCHVDVITDEIAHFWDESSALWISRLPLISAPLNSLVVSGALLAV